MPDNQALLRDGDEKLDRNDFAGALEAYRAALLAGEPTRPLLGNIHLAQDHELLELIRHARTQRPGSSELALVEAHQLAHMRNHRAAVDLYSTLLDASPSERDALMLRLARHQAGARHGAETLPDDFEHIWKLGESDPAARPFRRGLLRQLLAVDRPEAIPVLQSIVARLAAEPDAAALVTIKIRELEGFAALEKSPLLSK